MEGPLGSSAPNPSAMGTNPIIQPGWSRAWGPAGRESSQQWNIHNPNPRPWEADDIPSSHGSTSLGTFLAQNTQESEEQGRTLLIFHRFMAGTSGPRGILCDSCGGTTPGREIPYKGTNIPVLPIPSCQHQLQGIGEGTNFGAPELQDLVSCSSRIPLLIPGPEQTELLNPGWECRGGGGKLKENK